MSFEEEQLKVLRETSQKLTEELEGETSPEIVSELVTMLVFDALGYCGPGIFTRIGQTLVGHIRAETGYCEKCPDLPKPATDVDNLCDDCRRKFRAETDHILSGKKDEPN